MFEEKDQEQVVEETLENSAEQNVEKASAEDASSTTADKNTIRDEMKENLIKALKKNGWTIKK